MHSCINIMCIEFHSIHSADDRPAYLVNKHALLMRGGVLVTFGGLGYGFGYGGCVSVGWFGGVELGGV